MSTLIFAILSYILLYKYLALFLVAYLAALLIPLPSNTSLLAASTFASQGYLNIYIVMIVAFIGNVSADITGFLLARKYGREVLLKIGFRKLIESKNYAKLEKFIVEHSKITIFVTRFFGGVGPLVNIITGLSKDISFKKFLKYGIAGEFVYVISLSMGGYFLGSAWEEIVSSFEMVTYTALLLVIMFVMWKIYFRRKRGE